MQGVTLTINADDLRHMSGVFSAIADRGDDTRPMMEDIAAYGATSTQMRFRLQESPDGTPWLKSARAKAKGGQTLRRSGDLQRSFVGEATANQASWGTNLQYAHVHQFGLTIRPVNVERLAFVIPGIGFRTATEVTIPARPMVGINSDDRAGIKAIIQDHFVGGIQ